MQLPTDLIPMFITLAGARDRAQHEGKTVGTVHARATAEINIAAITKQPPSEDVQKRIAVMQQQACAIMRHTLQTLASDISLLLNESEAPAAVNFMPKVQVFLMGEDMPELKAIQSAFIEDIQRDPEMAESLSHVTACIVEGWQG